MSILACFARHDRLMLALAHFGSIIVALVAVWTVQLTNTGIATFVRSVDSLLVLSALQWFAKRSNTVYFAVLALTCLALGTSVLPLLLMLVVGVIVKTFYKKASSVTCDSYVEKTNYSCMVSSIRWAAVKQAFQCCSICWARDSCRSNCIEPHHTCIDTARTGRYATNRRVNIDFHCSCTLNLEL